MVDKNQAVPSVQDNMTPWFQDRLSIILSKIPNLA